MRIYAIRDCGVSMPATRKSTSHSLSKKNEVSFGSFNQDCMSFLKCNTAKGVTAGTGFGLLAMGALSVVSGLSVKPVAYGIYAAAFGTAGLLAGKALDNEEGANSKKLA